MTWPLLVITVTRLIIVYRFSGMFFSNLLVELSYLIKKYSGHQTTEASEIELVLQNLTKGPFGGSR